MILNKNDYEALYEELKLVNEENYQGNFYVTRFEDLEEQAMQFLINENYIDDENEDNDQNVSLNISWKGEGLYCFCGLGFINKYSLNHIVDLFEAETEVSHKIYLGDHNEIEKAKNNFTNVHVVWNIDVVTKTYSLEEIIESEKPTNTSGILSELSKRKGNRQWGNHEVEIIKDMNNETFYEFLKQYNKLLLMS
ncbi:hypothetical protein KZX50_09930 [Bacillus infantis]|uniref:hypothetical protein n=1 Tax=Bacillus infantis TaxID=324767 RepID=UPI0020036F09|nr:hypothetical protein [Bacillus infantis]MCK6205755.1 hypothetical protein [Bacillus infantis]